MFSLPAEALQRSVRSHVSKISQMGVLLTLESLGEVEEYVAYLQEEEGALGGGWRLTPAQVRGVLALREEFR